jgi:hypothetical protein
MDRMRPPNGSNHDDHLSTALTRRFCPVRLHGQRRPMTRRSHHARTHHVGRSRHDTAPKQPTTGPESRSAERVRLSVDGQPAQPPPAQPTVIDGATARQDQVPTSSPPAPPAMVDVHTGPVRWDDAPADRPVAKEVPVAVAPAPGVVPPATGPGEMAPIAAVHNGGCTPSQLRRFIKSRAYVPMHELRRRFALNGAEDDVCMVDLDGGRVYVGLPNREGRILGDLLRAGEVGFELSLDPCTPIVVGVYPMRPVPRP